MKYIYLDNGASSFPKAPGVAEAMADYILHTGVNVSRGAYSMSYLAENIIYEARELICQLFNFPKAENVVFTKSITESMNVLIKGLLKEGDHVIVSSMEHNAVMRPLNSMKNIEFTRIQCNSVGQMDFEDFKRAIRSNTKAVIMSHASNVSGTILDLEKVGQICRNKGIYFIIDSAQTAGFLDMDFQALKADAIGFTGHKGLLGPQGIGGFLINDNLAKNTSSLIDGGTGSLSDEEVQPEYMPDKYEAGTLNIPGIYGLHRALKYLLAYGIKNIREEEISLLKVFLEGINNMDRRKVKIIGLEETIARTPVLSLDFPKYDNGLIGHELSKNYGIMTRTGMHCAPSAHKTLGTFPHGTVRFSLSHFNSLEELSYTLDAINKIIKA